MSTRAHLRPLAPPDPPLSDGVVAITGASHLDADSFARGLADPGVTDFARTDRVPTERLPELFTSIEDRLAAREAVGLIVRHADSGEFAGGAIVRHIDWVHLDAELGCWIVPEARGRGLGVRALRLITRWSFEELGLERLHAFTDVTEIPTQRVFEQAGFRRDGVLRGASRRPDGTRRDVVSHCLLHTDHEGT